MSSAEHISEQCNKKSFDKMQLAISRANEINKTNRKYNQQEEQLRPYKCEKCHKYHLTKMAKHDFKYNSSPQYKSHMNEKSFIKKMAEYWNEKLNRKYKNKK